jgi:hypothetical protein
MTTLMIWLSVIIHDYPLPISNDTIFAYFRRRLRLRWNISQLTHTPHADTQTHGAVSCGGRMKHYPDKLAWPYEPHYGNHGSNYLYDIYDKNVTRFHLIVLHFMSENYVIMEVDT